MFVSIIAPDFFILDKSATAYADNMTGLDEKGVDGVFHLTTDVLEDPAYPRKDGHQGLLSLVKVLGKPALIDHGFEYMAVHVFQGHGLIAPEITGRYLLSGDYQSIGELHVFVFIVVHFF